MNRLLKIFLLAFALVLTFDTRAKADTLSPQTAEILPAENTPSSSEKPANQHNLFNLHHQGTSGVVLLERLSITESLDDSKDDIFGNTFAESALKKQLSICLLLSKTLDRNLTVKKLIFPFHSHL